MIIKNIGAKIISVGTTVLMPDTEMKVSKEIAETPAIKAFARLGFVKVEDDEAEKAAAAKKAAEEAAAKKAEEGAAAKKKTAEEAAKKTAKSADQNK